MRYLVDEAFPEAKKIRLVMDASGDTFTRSHIRAVRAGAGAAYRAKAGISLHAETCQLAQYGGNRVKRFGKAMFIAPDW